MSAHLDKIKRIVGALACACAAVEAILLKIIHRESFLVPTCSGITLAAGQLSSVAAYALVVLSKGAKNEAFKAHRAAHNSPPIYQLRGRDECTSSEVYKGVCALAAALWVFGSGWSILTAYYLHENLLHDGNRRFAIIARAFNLAVAVVYSILLWLAATDVWVVGLVGVRPERLQMTTRGETSNASPEPNQREGQRARELEREREETQDSPRTSDEAPGVSGEQARASASRRSVAEDGPPQLRQRITVEMHARPGDQTARDSRENGCE